MSGGEQQRVAIARSIVNEPKILLADEPTGNLDSRTGKAIMEIFHELHRDGVTVILVTHEMSVAVQAKRVIRMRDGRIGEDRPMDEATRHELLTHGGALSGIETPSMVASPAPRMARPLKVEV